jgi:diacylglycerol kinase
MFISSGPARSDADEDAVTPRGPSAPPIPPTSRRELADFLNSFVYAWHGLVHAVRTQRNARVHMALGSAAIILGILLRISTVEFAMIFVAITLVFIAEMFNTVAEACIDLVTKEYHPLARIAKDVAAGAVLLNAMLSVIIGLLVFTPHLWPLAIQALLLIRR